MPNTNLLSDFSDYIEGLCTAHVEIHQFIQLNDEQQLQQAKKLVYPLVTLEKLTISYTGMEDALSKNRYTEMMFLDKVSDMGDFDTIQDVKNRMERIAEDFLKKMKLDKKNRLLYPFLKCLKISNIALDFVENKGNGQYGALLAFNFELPFEETLEDGRFV